MEHYEMPYLRPMCCTAGTDPIALEGLSENPAAQASNFVR
ncbi:hypothetical protein TI01_0196 [Lysobacter sp. A03]|nr:hypothetical protein TI01_0196 [Lysobacter sp. A03]